MFHNLKKYPVNHKLRVGFGVILAILLSIASVPYLTIERLVDNQNWVSHTHEVIATAEAVKSDLQQMESGERGYFILGTQSAIAQYQNAFQQYYPDLRRLKQLTSDNPTQQDRINELIDKCEEKASICEKIIQSHQLDGDESKVKIEMSGRSNAVMNEIRTLIGEIISDEYRLLQKRASKAQWETTRAKIVIPSLVMLSFLVMIIGYTYIILKLQILKDYEGNNKS